MQFGQTSAPVTQSSITAVVTRCRCKTDAQRAEHFGLPCPRGRKQNLGTISYWHRNPLMRAAYRVARLLGYRGDFWA